MIYSSSPRDGVFVVVVGVAVSAHQFLKSNYKCIEMTPNHSSLLRSVCCTQQIRSQSEYIKAVSFRYCLVRYHGGADGLMGARWSKQREAGFEEAGASGGRQSKVGTSFETRGACKNCRPADEVSLPNVGLNWCCEMEYNEVAECMRREKGLVRECVRQWDEFRVCREAAKKAVETQSN